MPVARIERIVSGGQTGADRGGLDAALDLGLPHGGWCPRGRRAEDGEVPAKYRLTETASDDYVERTELNVLHSDGTVVFTYGVPEGGSALTLLLAERHRKPFLHLDLASTSPDAAARLLRDWMEDRGVGILNVAGQREGKAAGIRDAVWDIVKRALA